MQSHVPYSVHMPKRHTAITARCPGLRLTALSARIFPLTLYWDSSKSAPHCICLILWNHLEERLLDQAQAWASYTPLFWGHSRSIPQGMILDVQPLVKSLFCPIRASPNGFFDFEASTP